MKYKAKCWGQFFSFCFRFLTLTCYRIFFFFSLSGILLITLLRYVLYVNLVIVCYLALFLPAFTCLSESNNARGRAHMDLIINQFSYSGVDPKSFWGELTWQILKNLQKVWYFLGFPNHQPLLSSALGKRLRFHLFL